MGDLSQQAVDRLATVLASYELFNAKDFDGSLAYFHEDAVLEDALIPGTSVQGKVAISRMWHERFEGEMTVTASPGTMYDSGDAVVTLVSCQPYGPDGARLGESVSILHRLHFRDGLIAHLEARTVDEIPEKLRGLFLSSSIHSDLAWVRHEIERLVFARSWGPGLSAEETTHYESLVERELGDLCYLRVNS